MAGKAAEELKKPAISFAAGAALVGFLVILAYPHESFQFIGFTGIQLTGILYLLSFESPAAFLGAFTEKLGGAVEAASGAASGAASAVSSAAATKLPEAGSSLADMKLKMPDTLTVATKRLQEEAPSAPTGKAATPPPPISPGAQKLAEAAAAAKKVASSVAKPDSGDAKKSPAAQKMSDAMAREQEQASAAKREAAKMVADRSKNGAA